MAFDAASFDMYRRSMADDENRIFVAIAAYREPELRLTMQSCIDQADHPERVVFGVCLQHDVDGDPATHPDCLDGLDATVRLESFDWRESRGGCWARHRVQGLYGGEEFTLQIDAHSRMEPGWDTSLIEMMAAFPSDKPLITGFPPLYNRQDGRDIIPSTDRSIVPVTVARSWDVEGWIWHPTHVVESETSMPRSTRFLSGAFVFTLGAWNREVRQDPEHLYTGEEFALAVRSFTSGYDLFNPSKVVVWHRNHPVRNPKFIHEAPKAEVRGRHDRALKRLRALLRGDRDRILVPYSVGSERSVQQFSEWSGLDCATFTASDDACNGVAPRNPQPHAV